MQKSKVECLIEAFYLCGRRILIFMSQETEGRDIEIESFFFGQYLIFIIMTRGNWKKYIYRLYVIGMFSKNLQFFSLFIQSIIKFDGKLVGESTLMDV